MRMFAVFSSLILCVLFVLAKPEAAKSADNFAAKVTETSIGEFDVEGAQKVGHAEAMRLHAAGVAFVDVRREIQFRQGHIAGAHSLELNTALSEASLGALFPKDQKLVFYCSDSQCHWSAYACAKALTWGYTDVVYFSEGWSVWLAKGYPTE